MLNFMISEERLAIARSSKLGKNCHGTALFLIGVAKHDEYVGIDYIASDRIFDHPNVSQLVPVDEPVEAALVFFNLGSHSGVVVSTDPVRVTHRTGLNEALRENQPLGEINNHCGPYRYFVKRPD